ncbi:YcgL domain-containing protein [Candidatus Nitrosacidococcus sp. I8]|uniref:YcgL domain-containing protein n=1 Tax=Candidatus Nitrosacidococcus sp. I8 TaxID=2942908 RepID=UPI002226BCAC|nr:YcgL domain-containing protein [Candidatus Nitrosacidococcus sp. I8]CAH9017646.1 Protein YcgL [Candidatus Nitrosacidococcus sp. I8]
MKPKILLCINFDQTLLLDAELEKYQSAHKYLQNLAQYSEILLTYLTDQSVGLIQSTLEDHQIPTPNFLIQSEKLEICEIEDKHWNLVQDWGSTKEVNKVTAIQYLIEKNSLDKYQVVFVGGEEKDLALFTHFKSVLVRNADLELQQEVLDSLPQGAEENFYIAWGSFLGLDGNYSAAILEGLAYFFPHTRAWMEVDPESYQDGVALQACAIYRSYKKEGSYLYIKKKEDFSQVPEKLMEILGKLNFVMELELHPNIPLAQGNPQEIINIIREKGYFLQIPQSEYRTS